MRFINYLCCLIMSNWCAIANKEKVNYSLFSGITIAIQLEVKGDGILLIVNNII